MRNLLIIAIIGTCFGMFLYSMAPKTMIVIPYVSPLPAPVFPELKSEINS